MNNCIAIYSTITKQKQKRLLLRNKHSCRKQGTFRDSIEVMNVAENSKLYTAGVK